MTDMQWRIWSLAAAAGKFFEGFVVPAVAITLARFYITESASWLIVRGAHDEAETALSRLLHRTPRSSHTVALARPLADEPRIAKQSLLSLFDRRNLRAT